VCCFLRHPPTAEAYFLMIDAPGIYRKVAAYCHGALKTSH